LIWTLCAVSFFAHLETVEKAGIRERAARAMQRIENRERAWGCQHVLVACAARARAMVLRCTTPPAFLAQSLDRLQPENSSLHCCTMLESENMAPQSALKRALETP